MVRLWETSLGLPLQTVQTPQIKAVAFSPDRKELGNRFVRQDVQALGHRLGILLQTCETHTDWVNTIAFSPDSKQQASASHKTVRLWDTSSGALLKTLKGHTFEFNIVAVSEDVKQLVSTSHDKTIRLWDMDSGTSLQILEGYTDRVKTFTFSQDGKQLAFASRDKKTVRLWDAPSIAPLQMLGITIHTLSWPTSESDLQTDRGPSEVRSCSSATNICRGYLYSMEVILEEERYVHVRGIVSASHSGDFRLICLKSGFSFGKSEQKDAE